MNHHNSKTHGTGSQRKSLLDETVTLLTTKASKTSATSSIDRTFLATGFGLRNADSLERALREDQLRKQKEMMDKARGLLPVQGELGEEEEYAESDRYSDMMSQTESLISISPPTSSTSSKLSSASKRLEYLMGTTGAPIEEEASSEEWESAKAREESEEQTSVPPTTEAMRQAQKYLRTHRIFEFFQFLIAHLLSAVPDNAIEFITDMLSKCLIFRSGYGEPPLLYNRRHIEELFNLMDPMRTGYINYNQYKTGMHTLGICTYDPVPPKNEEGYIAKDIFVEGAYECLTDLLNDMIRRRGAGVRAPNAPPPTPDIQTQILWTGGSEGSSASSAKEKKKSEGVLM